MKTITNRLLTYEDADTKDANRFSIYLHGLTEKKRQHLVKLFNEGKLILRNHRDGLQAILACEQAVLSKINKLDDDDRDQQFDIDQAFISIWGI